MEVTVKSRLRYLVPKAQWCQGPGQAESETQCSEWLSRSELGSSFLNSTFYTWEIKARQGLGEPCFILGHLSMLMAWSWERIYSLKDEIVQCLPSSSPPGCLPGHLILLETVSRKHGTFVGGINGTAECALALEPDRAGVSLALPFVSSQTSASVLASDLKQRDGSVIQTPTSSSRHQNVASMTWVHTGRAPSTGLDCSKS